MKLLEMRNYFLLFFVGTCCLLASGISSAQNANGRIEIRGSVVDSSGEALIGVSIRVKKTPNIGTSTDLNGKYILEVPAGSVLIYTMVGFQEQEVATTGRTVINLTLLPAIRDEDDVVVVAFGKQKKADVVGAVTTINPEELKVPSSNLTTALAGRLAGVIAYQRSGEPGQDNANFFIRGVSNFGGAGNRPLILIDNIEVSSTDLAQLQPDDIATFSILKDATATALYGARGANGVLLVTTKRGKEGKAKITLRSEKSSTRPTSVIELADPVTYMKLHNEAVLTRDPLGIRPYTQEKIENTMKGNDPLVYPATDWREELFKKSSMVNRYNFNVSGGGQAATYFLSGTYNVDNGMLKVPESSNFNNNIKLKNYSLRSNVVINVTKTTQVNVLLSGNFTDYIGPMDGGAAMYGKLVTSNPVLFPSFYEPTENTKFAQHILFGNSDNNSVLYQNPYADMISGYRESTNSRLNALFEVKQDLSSVIEGLAFRGLFNTSRVSAFGVRRAYQPFFYQPAFINKDGSYDLIALNEQDGTENLNYVEEPKAIRNNTYIEAQLAYNRNLNDDHDLSGMLVLLMNNRITANAGSLQLSLPSRNLGLSGRATYAYKKKYAAEFAFGYNGSERFYETKRWGFFPSMGVAWTVSREDFWEPLANVITQFRVRANYGFIGNDAIGDADDRFFYLSEINLNASSRSASFGEFNGYARNGVAVSRYENKDITWERSAKSNLGIEMNLFNSIQLIVDVFKEKRTNILLTRSTIPITTGLAAVPQANLGEASSHGVEGSLNVNKTFGNGLWVQGYGNFTYATSKILKFEEPNYDEKYLSRVGQNINQAWGYIAERLFVDEADVANSPRQNFGPYMAGDIKYRDLNGDGQITSLDRTPIGNPADPTITYGFGFSTGYKAFDLSVFFQGNANTSFFVSQTGTAPFVESNVADNLAPSPVTYRRQNALLLEYANSYWSEDNRNIYAKLPRLSTVNIANNQPASTWNLRDASFLRLKNLEIGYSLPARLIKRAHLSTVRVYANGSNLYLWSGFKMWDVEMGSSGLGYPVQKVYNLGLQITL